LSSAEQEIRGIEEELEKLEELEKVEIELNAEMGVCGIAVETFPNWLHRGLALLPELQSVRPKNDKTVTILLGLRLNSTPY
jgi:hypothetical protein